MTKVGKLPSQTTNLLLTSPPKSGTHFLKGIVEVVTGRCSTPLIKSREAALEHAQHVIEELNYRQFLFHGHLRVHQTKFRFRRHWQVVALLRDPRDILLAVRDDLRAESSDQGRAIFGPLRQLSVDEQLLALIDGRVSGGHEIGSIQRHCRGFANWQEKGATVVRYEDLLVGADEACESLAAALRVDAVRVQKAARKLSGSGTRTLNKGQVGRWKSEFSDAVCDKFRLETDGIVEQLGYRWDS